MDELEKLKEDAASSIREIHACDPHQPTTNANIMGALWALMKYCEGLEKKIAEHEELLDI